MKDQSFDKRAAWVWAQAFIGVATYVVGIFLSTVASQLSVDDPAGTMSDIVLIAYSLAAVMLGQTITFSLLAIGERNNDVWRSILLLITSAIGLVGTAYLYFSTKEEFRNVEMPALATWSIGLYLILTVGLFIAAALLVYRSHVSKGRKNP